MKFRALVMIWLIPFFSSAQYQAPSPRYSIHLTTMDGNTLKGLLMEVSDSSITIYPGKQKDWKSNLPPVHFSYAQIQQIKLKKKGGTVKGLLIGSLIGATPILLKPLIPVAIGGPKKSGFGSLAIFTGSVTVGTLWGGKAVWGANINGELSIFKTFKNRYDAKCKN